MPLPEDLSREDLAAAEAYERLLVPGLFTPSTRRAVALAGLVSGECLLDLACGTGIGARLALCGPAAGCAAVGVDHDAAMLQLARRNTGGVVWLRANALRLPLRDSSFDVVLCLQGLQFMDDRTTVLQEVRRVLKPGGRLVASTWGSLDTMPGHAAVYGAMDAHGIDTTSPRRGFRLGLDGLRSAAVATGFASAEWRAEDDIAYFASAAHFVEGLLRGAPYTRRVLAALPTEQRSACARDAVRRLSSRSTGGTLLLPTRCNLMLARG